MKKLITTLGILLLVGAIAIPVLAHGPGWGRGGHMMGDRGYHHGYGSHYGRGYEQMTGGQRNQLDKLNRRFYDETAELRSDIWTKSEALNTLLNASNPDTEKAKALQKEISDLKAKLSQARIKFEIEERKIYPDLRMGMGYGYHMGNDRHMGAYDPGSCWN